MVAFGRSLLFPLVIGALLGAAPPAQPQQVFPPLPAATADGWRHYTAVTEQRIDRELRDAKRFLTIDFQPTAGVDRRSILAGQMPTASMTSRRADGLEVEVPDGWVHHWRGAVLIPGVRLDRVFQRLQEEVPGTGKGDVVASSILARNGDHMRTSIKLQRSGSFWGWSYQFVYNTEHDVLFRRRSAGTGTSTSAATKIAEIHKPGSAQERELAAGEDSRLLQRWNSYWRYEEVAAGVIAECESITLSRAGLFGMGRGIADDTARESMEKALVNLRGHFATAGRTPLASSPVR